MPLRRKNSAYLLIAIIFFILISSINSVYAEDVYPLETEEKLLETIIIDQNNVEIFTQLDDNYYLKRLQRNEDKWMVESTEAIYPKWTGLEINEIESAGDRKLASAVKRELESYGLDTASLPLVLDYSQSEFLPTIGTQYENSCVGWSAGYYLRTYQEARDIGWQVKAGGTGISSHTFSPTFIYNQIRQGGDGVDGGAYIVDAGNLLINTGAATLESFPYVPGDFSAIPDPAVIQSANPYRISAWRLLFSELDSKEYIIQRAKEYLNTGDLVVVGSEIGLKFQNPYMDGNGNSIITREYYPPYRHAYVIVGYDDTLITPDGVGAFKLINSWGEEWGNDGFCYISYQAFAPNVLEGYVFTDIANAEAQELTLDINDSVIFNMNLSGEGRFDFSIMNENDRLIYEAADLQGQQGLNTFVWNGRDMADNCVDDGQYTLSVIPYIDDTPQAPFNAEFNKLVKAEAESASAYSYEDVIQYVDIPITFNSDGTLSIKVDYEGAVYELISNEAVKAGDSNTYKIYKRDFDFNNIDLNKVNIIIDIL